MAFPFAVFSTNTSIRGLICCWLWMFFRMETPHRRWFSSSMPKGRTGFSLVKLKLLQWWKGLIARLPNKSVCGLNIVLPDRKVFSLHWCWCQYGKPNLWAGLMFKPYRKYFEVCRCMRQWYYYISLCKDSRECTYVTLSFFYWPSLYCEGEVCSMCVLFLYSRVSEPFVTYSLPFLISEAHLPK